ncbi:MAG: hypothetical protein ACRDQZ_13050 [Mycobacteriales bacterium]
MKARTTKVKGFAEADMPTLEASINTWFAAAAERTFVSAVYQASQVGGEPYTCLVFYTE